MTAKEALSAVKSRDYRVIYVWEDKTNSSSRLAVHVRVHQLLLEYLGTKSGSDYAFTTSSGEHVKHLGQELEKLGEIFGRKFQNIATAVSETGSVGDVRGAATHMTHSLDTQQKGGAEQAVSRYVCEVATPLDYHLSLRYLMQEEQPDDQPPSPDDHSDKDFVTPPTNKRRMPFSKEDEEELRAYFGKREKSPKTSECSSSAGGH